MQNSQTRLIKNPSKKPLSEQYVQKVMPTFNNTFVILVSEQRETNNTRNAYYKSIIFHTDFQGNLIKTFDFEEVMITFFMATDEELIVPLIEAQEIQIINMRTYDIRKIKFQFNESNELQLYYFSHTKLLSICDTDLGKLFYCQPLNLSNQNIIATIQSKQVEIQHLYLRSVSKGDHNSMVIYLIKSGQQEQLQFQIKINELQLIEGKWTPKVRTIQLDIKLGYENHLWYFKDTLYVMDQNEDQNGDSQQTILKIKDYQIQMFAILQAQNYSEMEVSVMDGYTYIRQKCQTLQQVDYTVEHIVNLSQNSIVTECDFEARIHMSEVYDYDPTHLFIYGITTEKNILYRNMWFCEMRDVYMNLLLEINEDFDDDLLMDMIEMLE